jgi:exosortase K
MRTRLIAITTALLIAWILKAHYSDARPDDLRWILTPTARLVGVVSGATFTFQPGEGYFSREQLFLIEKSCAGVNFMIAAFAMLVFTLFHHIRSWRSVFAVVGISLAAGYASALLVNTVRITIAMWLATHPGLLRAFTHAEVHRIEGVLVYFGGMVMLYETTRRLDRHAPMWLRS